MAFFDGERSGERRMQQWAYLGKGSIWNERNVKGETNQNMSSAETMTKTILSEAIFEIKPFHKVLIADPWYLKKIESGDNKNVSGMKELMADFTISAKPQIAKVHLRKIHLAWEEDSVEDEMWELLFYSVLDAAENMEFPKAALEQMFYPDLIEKTGDLACDTARYRIDIDGKTEEVYNGGDGYFGKYFTYKGDRFSFVALSLPEALFDKEDIMQLIHNLFEVVEKNCEV